MPQPLIAELYEDGVLEITQGDDSLREYLAVANLDEARSIIARGWRDADVSLNPEVQAVPSFGAA